MVVVHNDHLQYDDDDNNDDDNEDGDEDLDDDDYQFTSLPPLKV